MSEENYVIANGKKIFVERIRHPIYPRSSEGEHNIKYDIENRLIIKDNNFRSVGDIENLPNLKNLDMLWITSSQLKDLSGLDSLKNLT